MWKYIVRVIHQWKKTRGIHNPIITVQIHKQNLLDNMKLLQNMAPTWQIAPVLKSNAYGHDLVTIASIVAEQSPVFICVDSYPEAEKVRHAGIETPILIMGFTPISTMRESHLKETSFVITSIEQLEEARNLSISIQIKFDTGMHRRGIDLNDFDKAAEIISNAKYTVAGVMSHFSESEKKSDVTMQQISKWNALVAKCKTAFPQIKYYHLANSGGFAYHDIITANVGRAGLAIYGLNPGNLPDTLKPVLEMKSIVSEIRTLHAGESIGYGGTYTASEDIKVATIPVGYFEGLKRLLSNRGVFMHESGALPIIGRISMNMSCCDVSKASKISIGDTVTIFSANPAQPNSIENCAKMCGEMPYEIMVGIPAGLRRVIV